MSPAAVRCSAYVSGMLLRDLPGRESNHRDIKPKSSVTGEQGNTTLLHSCTTENSYKWCPGALYLFAWSSISWHFQKDNRSLRDAFYSSLLKKWKRCSWQLQVKTNQNPLCANVHIFFREIHSRISALETIKATIQTLHLKYQNSLASEFLCGDKDEIWIHLNAVKDESPVEAAGRDKDKTSITPASCRFSHSMHTSPWCTEGNFALWLPVVTNLKSKSYVQDCSQ